MAPALILVAVQVETVLVYPLHGLFLLLHPHLPLLPPWSLNGHAVVIAVIIGVAAAAVLDRERVIGGERHDAVLYREAVAGNAGEKVAERPGRKGNLGVRIG